MAGIPADGIWWLNYNKYEDLRIQEIGIQRCMPDYEFGPIVRDIYILHYVFKGEGTLVIGGRDYKVCEHEFFLLPPDELVYYRADAKNPWHYAWIQFHGFKATELLQKIGLTKKNPVFAPVSVEDGIIDCLSGLFREYDKEYSCIGGLYRLFQCMIDQCPPDRVENEKTEPALQYVRCAVEYISQKYCDPILVRNIAEYCGIDRAYLSKIFKYATGLTLQEYLIQFRLKRARQLLEDTDLPVQHVSYSVGYNDPFTFSKVFKKHMGLSPSDWRKKQKK